MKWTYFIILMVVPWLATYLGSLTAVYLNLKTDRAQGALLGFAGGIMIAASVWSLVIPAFEQAGTDFMGILTVTGGFVGGCLLMLLLDKIVPHQHIDDDTPEGAPSKLSRPLLLVMAVALHNIPEGVALGVVIAAAASGTSEVSWFGALMFGVGLALQNFPEGLAVVYPMRQSGMSRKKSHLFGLVASFAEPISAFLGLALASTLSVMAMPLMLSVAAGAMIFIVVEELIPESQSQCGHKHSHAATYGFLIGFWIMAVMGALGT